MSRAEHYPTLDGLRAIAILLVLYNHGPQLMGSGDGPDRLFWSGSRGAWLGVDLFFVLSGFLITNILLHAKGTPHALRRFWVRRGLRIFPLVYAYLASLAALARLVPGFAMLRSVSAFVYAATYTLNFRIAQRGWTAAAFGILWSLCVEEHFYFMWPLIVLFTRRRVVTGVLCGLVLLTPILRAEVATSLGPVGVYVLTFCRWDTLAWGALLAVLYDSPARLHVLRLARWLLWPALGFVAYVVLLPLSAVDLPVPRWFEDVGYSLVGLSFAVCCATLLDAGRLTQRLLGNRYTGWVGRVSYGIYIWHVLVAQVVTRALTRAHVHAPLAIRALVWLTVLLPVAGASYRFYEAPILEWKDRLAG